MKLWLLEKKKPDRLYETMEGVLIRASNEAAARRVANEAHGDEGLIWQDDTRTTCSRIMVAGKPGIILRDFCNG